MSLPHVLHRTLAALVLSVAFFPPNFYRSWVEGGETAGAVAA